MITQALVLSKLLTEYYPFTIFCSSPQNLAASLQHADPCAGQPWQLTPMLAQKMHQGFSFTQQSLSPASDRLPCRQAHAGTFTLGSSQPPVAQGEILQRARTKRPWSLSSWWSQGTQQILSTSSASVQVLLCPAGSCRAKQCRSAREVCM